MHFNFYAGYASSYAAEGKGKGTISSPRRVPENKRAVIRPGRHHFGTLSCNLKAATNRVSRSVSLKKIKISRVREGSRVWKRCFALFQEVLEARGWLGQKETKILRIQAKDLITESNPSFSILSFYLYLLMRSTQNLLSVNQSNHTRFLLKGTIIVWLN